MSLHFTRDEFAARRKATIAALEARGLDGAADVPAGEHVLPHRLRHLRLRVFPVLSISAPMATVPADPRPISARRSSPRIIAGYPRLGRWRRTRTPRPNSSDMLKACGLRGQEARRRMGCLWPHRPQRHAPARRPSTASRPLVDASDLVSQPAPGEERRPRSPMSRRRRISPTSRSTKRTACRAPGVSTRRDPRRHAEHHHPQ